MTITREPHIFLSFKGCVLEVHFNNRNHLSIHYSFLSCRFIKFTIVFGLPLWTIHVHSYSLVTLYLLNSALIPADLRWPICANCLRSLRAPRFSFWLAHHPMSSVKFLCSVYCHVDEIARAVKFWKWMTPKCIQSVVRLPSLHFVEQTRPNIWTWKLN